MKLSLCNEVLRELPFDRQCAYAAAVGYGGLELAPFTLAENPETLTARDAAGIRASLDAEGLACPALHWLLAAPDGLSITTADDGVRARTVDLMRRLVDFAAEVGAGVLVHGSPKQRDLPVGDETAARARALDCFRTAGEAAERTGVLYCIEALSRRETGFVNTVAEAAKLVEEAGSRGLCTMIDTAATARDDGDVVDVLDEFHPRGLIAHVHLNDPNRRAPGEGDLRFAPILAALRRHGYRGWASVEPFVYQPDGPTCAARAAGYLRGIESALQ